MTIEERKAYWLIVGIANDEEHEAWRRPSYFLFFLVKRQARLEYESFWSLGIQEISEMPGCLRDSLDALGG